MPQKSMPLKSVPPKASAVQSRPPRSAAAAATRVRRRPARTAASPRGVLVLVVGAEGRGKEMLVAIARRRFEADASLEFPARVTTRAPSEASGDTVVSRRAMRELAAAGALLCRWETDGHAFGLGVAARRSLEDGRTVVVVAGREAAADLRLVWDDVRVIEVTAGADSARLPLGREAALRGATLALHHRGDVASAVRSFHDMITRIRLERLGETSPSGRSLSSGGVARRLAGGAQPRKGLRPDRPRA